MNRSIAVHALVLSLASLTGCAGYRSAALPPMTGPLATAPAAPTLSDGLVATVVESNGQTLVEFAYAQNLVLEPGSPFRVFAADGTRVKGMLQVTE
ncbi:MAG: hypothetical protein AAB263_10900, partial [Planctomycetota bacterium]